MSIIKILLHILYFFFTLFIEYFLWLKPGLRTLLFWVFVLVEFFLLLRFLILPSLKLCLVSPSAVMLRAALFQDVGLFDESLPACEDYDLWLRISCRYPIDLIEKPLVVKTGGHLDQLSARYKGMDRFRIKAMTKILAGERLTHGQRKATLKELAFKCRIYGEGCLRRNRMEEGAYYLGLASKL